MTSLPYVMIHGDVIDNPRGGVASDGTNWLQFHVEARNEDKGFEWEMLSDSNTYLVNIDGRQARNAGTSIKKGTTVAVYGRLELAQYHRSALGRPGLDREDDAVDDDDDLYRNAYLATVRIYARWVGLSLMYNHVDDFDRPKYENPPVPGPLRTNFPFTDVPSAPEPEGHQK